MTLKNSDADEAEQNSFGCGGDVQMVVIGTNDTRMTHPGY